MLKNPFRLLFALVALWVLPMSAWAQLPTAAPAPAAQQAAPAPVAGPPIDSAYLVGVGDVVEISLVGRGDFGSRVRVDNDGTVLLPLIGNVKAVNRTVLELADDIRKALVKGQIYTDPVVRVEVVAISSRYVTVLGNVGSPGLIPLDRNYRLSEMLAKIGGRAGNGADYILLTHAGGKPQRYSIAKLGAGSVDDDPVVTAGDKIYIPPADDEVFYISGQVNSPGAFPLTEGLTIRRAIARAGGVTPNGSESKIKIIRDNKPVKSPKLEDPVQVNDTITIGERLF